MSHADVNGVPPPRVAIYMVVMSCVVFIMCCSLIVTVFVRPLAVEHVEVNGAPVNESVKAGFLKIVLCKWWLLDVRATFLAQEAPSATDRVGNFSIYLSSDFGTGNHTAVLSAGGQEVARVVCVPSKNGSGYACVLDVKNPDLLARFVAEEGASWFC